VPVGRLHTKSAEGAVAWYLGHMENNATQMPYDWSFIQEASDVGLEHQWNIVVKRIQHNSNYPGMTVEQTLEFRDALKVEMDQRWENGGKQKFQEMLNRTFGSNATQIA
jgi:hypothetical protein